MVVGGISQLINKSKIKYGFFDVQKKSLHIFKKSTKKMISKNLQHKR